MLFMIFLLLLVGNCSLAYTSSFNLDIETDHDFYYPADDVYVSGRLTYEGWPLQNRIVSIWAKNPDNSTYILTSRQTDSDGRYNFSFKLSSQAQLGLYTAGVNYACENGETLVNSTAFEVVSLFPWDVTGDGCVGVDDLFAVAMHYGTERNQPNYDALCDINHDGCIDISDIFEVAQHFGEENP